MSCYDFLAKQSPQGAARWFNCLVEIRSRLADDVDRCPLAYESQFEDREIREILFKTRNGRHY